MLNELDNNVNLSKMYTHFLLISKEIGMLSCAYVNTRAFARRRSMVSFVPMKAHLDCEKHKGEGLWDAEHQSKENYRRSYI